MIKINLLTKYNRLQDLENKFMVIGGKTREEAQIGSLGLDVPTIIFKTDSQQRSTVITGKSAQYSVKN